MFFLHCYSQHLQVCSILFHFAWRNVLHFRTDQNRSKGITLWSWPASSSTVLMWGYLHIYILNGFIQNRCQVVKLSHKTLTDDCLLLFIFSVDLLSYCFAVLCCLNFFMMNALNFPPGINSVSVSGLLSFSVTFYFNPMTVFSIISKCWQYLILIPSTECMWFSCLQTKSFICV